MTQMESTPDHVVNKAIDTPKQWKETMAKCQKLVKLTDLGVKVMAII
jgi:hypothetical protein